jgi:hypothetical protein
MGAESQRKVAALLIIMHRKQMRICKLQSEKLQRNIGRTVNFIEFLKNLEKRREVLPAVDVDGFRNSFEPGHPRLQKLQRQVRILRNHAKELVPLKKGSGDWYFNLLHPESKSGKTILRFEERVQDLSYDGVCEIIEYLSDNKGDFERLEQLLFDIGWQRKSFPFGLYRKAELPMAGYIFPEVIGDTLIDREWAFTPFDTLNGMDWPFKSAVDMLFEMMILTNPFQIARLYWDIIQEAAKCMQNVMVRSGVRSEDVEIDFDSLFPILMICVFVFGIDEWMQVALYVISFNEHVSDDPQLQFAMTYLEGLVTQILALDKEDLRRKAAVMRRQWVEEERDPLGLR